MSLHPPGEGLGGSVTDLAHDARFENYAQALAQMGNFPRLFATLEPQAKKRLLRAIVAEVRVTEDREALPDIRFLDPWARLLKLDDGEAEIPETLPETA